MKDETQTHWLQLSPPTANIKRPMNQPFTLEQLQNINLITTKISYRPLF